MARKKKSQERERNQQRRQEIKDADTLLEMFRKAHSPPPANLVVPGLIENIRKTNAHKGLNLSDETTRQIAVELAKYKAMVTVLPDWRKDSKEAQHELEALADAARGMLDQFAAIRSSLNMYLLPFPVTFSELMEKRFGPTAPRKPHNRLDFKSFKDLQEMLEVLIQACSEPPGLPGMPDDFPKAGKVNTEPLRWSLIHEVNRLLEPYLTEKKGPQIRERYICELLMLIHEHLEIDTVTNNLSRNRPRKS